ncbi:MAG: acyl carrier protein [Syntrophobacteraceae bacterium]
MNETLTRIREGIVEILPDAMGFEIKTDTFLSNIPEWDSMTSVNFKVFLEETFGVRIPDEMLEGESTVGELVEFIRRTD